MFLIHGVGLRAEAWNGQIDGLSEEFRVVAADMPGHGESDRIEGETDLAAFASRIASALEGPAVIVGHSMGALVALQLAIRQPGKVLGVAALNAIYRRTDEAKQAVRQRAEALSSTSFADPNPTLNRWFGSAKSKERSACETWLRSADLEGYRTAYKAFAEEDGPSDEELANLPCPALFMTGELEPNSTPEMSRKMADLAPKGRVQVIEGAAHMMPMTHPDQVNKALLDFARECLT